MNKSDSERLAHRLQAQGHTPADRPEWADLVVINMCSVRQMAVDKVSHRLAHIRRLNPKAKLVLTGCLLAEDKAHFKHQADAIWPLTGLEHRPLALSPRAFVPIMTGCNNFCSYCVVPRVRGRERSRKPASILRDVRRFVRQRHGNITLLGQNVNSYHADGVTFPELLRRIQKIPGDFTIEFVTSHPKDMSDELISVMAQSSKIRETIHLPVQSGDSCILKKMNRGYTAADYKKLVKKIRKKIPNVNISTDIIVGFPGETKKQFQNTVELLQETKFSQIYAAAYSPRPGTAALKLTDDVPAGEKKRRLQIVLAQRWN